MSSVLERLLLQFHRLTAAVKDPIPATGYNELCTAFLTNISFPNLICHLLLITSL